MTDQSDTLFQTPWQGVGDFRFDERVAQVFPDMIRRSVPGYGHVVGLTGLTAKRFAQPHTALYDLGCSLGATTLAMAAEVTTEGCRIVAVDNSEAMLTKAEQLASARAIDPLPIEWVLADLCELEFVPCSVASLNYTLQFIAPEKRQPLLTRLCNAMVLGGVLVLAEKVTLTDMAQDTLNTLHLDFKRANGYSELEIAGKRQAIEQVLIPESPETHIARLQASGFSEVIEFFHCLNFRAWLAIK